MYKRRARPRWRPAELQPNTHLRTGAMVMPTPDYSALVAGQREYFLSGSTRPASWRRQQLEAVKAMFTENRDELRDALRKDLRRNTVDADMVDITSSAKEADYALARLDAWIHRCSPNPHIFAFAAIRLASP